ncbi:putative oxidoreductase [Medicago truncatula]|uniref:Putative oxidoreductase n=1 Tax=Medicago truncatula TaxID=3880 RepID=A0A396I0J5_MEDTR|nr:putative oxidoreductase [Medicago truncatula]
MESEELRFFELNTGAKIPSVGLGTWLAEPGVVYDAISTAVNVSFFLIFQSILFFVLLLLLL